MVLELKLSFAEAKDSSETYLENQKIVTFVSQVQETW